MNWQKLSDKEYNLIWDKFYADFNFKPSVNIFPAIQTDLPYLKLDIFKIWLDYPDDYYDKFIELGEKLILYICQPNDLIYAIDW